METKNFEVNFEGITIYFYEINATLMEEVMDGVITGIPPLTRIWHNTSMTITHNSKSIRGRIIIIFKNQSPQSNSGISLICDLDAAAPLSIKASEMICRVVQYLFGWINSYAIDENIETKNGNKFLVPEFLYASSQFENQFPD